MRYEIRLSGFGGQGVILAGVVLGKAAALFDDKEVVQTQSYGPAARGGACKSDVIIGDERIRYPRINNADTLVALSQTAFDKFKTKINDGGGNVIVDSAMVDVTDDDRKYFNSNNIKLYQVGALETAEELGAKIAANMVIDGAVCAITDVISKDALIKSVKSTVPKSKLDLNIKAVERGYELGKKEKDEVA